MSDSQDATSPRPVAVHPSDARSKERTQAATEWLFAAAAVLALTLLFALVNWHWLQVNVVTYGWDRMDHLITSLVYNDMVRSPSAQTPFNLLAYSSYYPPLVHFGIVALYRLFGVSEDVAPFVNVFYLAGLLASVWAITRRLAGRGTALLATVLAGMFPMFFAMSRYLYLDFALTAGVTLAVALLLYTERFQRRGMALWFGLSLGLAFLIKWTTAAFLIGPLVYIVWRSGVAPTLLRQPRLLLPRWGALVLVLAASAALNLAWLLPARDAAIHTWLGWWLFPLLTFCLAGALYAIFAARPAADPAGQAVKNALSAAGVTVWLLSLWYLVNPEFADFFAFTAYGREEPFLAFGKYFREIVFEQMGILLALVLLAVLLVWLWQQRGHLRQTLLRLSDTAWVLLLWVGVAYFIFSFRVTLAHSRFVMPLLPAFAVWIAVGLSQWRPRWLRAVAVTGVLLIASAQFALISFDELAALRAPFVISVAGRPFNLLANGFFVQFPASERTDPGYAAAPEVLSVVDAARQAAGRDEIHLGLLVNSYPIHEKHFLYQIYTTFPQVRLRELARNWNNQPAYNQLFEMDYVLASDRVNDRIDEESQAVMARMRNDPADMFNQAFRPVQAWTLPNGETLTLYGRRFAATAPGLGAESILALLTYFGDRLGPGDAVVLAAPDQVYGLGLALPAAAGADIVPLPTDGADISAALDTLQALARSHERIFLVTHNAEQVDPERRLEGWLRANLAAGSEAWANSIQVTPFAPVQTSPITLTAPFTWTTGLQLAGAVQLPTLAGANPVAGGALVTRLTWTGHDGAPLKASLQLLAPDGQLAAQEDRDLSSGEQTFMLLIPRSTAPGPYDLALTVYDPSTQQRLALTEGGDAALLARVQVDANPARPRMVAPLVQPDDGEDEEG